MANLTNSYSLTDFQRNARNHIDSINETREPILLTVNGKVQAVILDPVTYQETEEQLERARLIEAIRMGEAAIQEGRTRSADDVFAELKAKHGL